MRAARSRRKKTSFIKKIKTFFVYSFISIVVLGFFVNTFLSNILEYSFALANSGGIVDIKSDEKYSISLISTNKLKEVKDISVITYDKKNKKLINFVLDSEVLISDKSDTYKIGELLNKVGTNQNEKINSLLSENIGSNLAFTFISSSDDFDIVRKVALGNGGVFDLYLLKDLKNISIRDWYFIYSFAGTLDSRSKKEVKVLTFDTFDNYLQDIYIDSTLGLESPSITVINSTSVNGLGKKYARIVGNMGGRVVDTTSADEQVSESFIIYKDKTPGFEYLSSKLGIKKSLSIEEVGLKYPEIIKSDLVIVIGIDKVE